MIPCAYSIPVATTTLLINLLSIDMIGWGRKLMDTYIMDYFIHLIIKNFVYWDLCLMNIQIKHKYLHTLRPLGEFYPHTSFLNFLIMFYPHIWAFSQTINHYKWVNVNLYLWPAHFPWEIYNLYYLYSMREFCFTRQH